MCEVASVVKRQHVGNLPVFGLFLLTCKVPGSLSEAYRPQAQVVSVNKATFVMDEKKLIILVQGHERLYN
jgi:hypothetical protein